MNKKYYPYIVSAALLIMLVICAFKLSSLEKELENLQHNMNSRLNQMSESIERIYYNINIELEEQSSFISYSNFTYGEPSIRNNEIELHCEVSPKEYTEATELAIVLDGSEYKMTRESNRYMANIKIPLFEDSQLESIIIRDGEITRTEELQQSFVPRYEFLTTVYANFEGNGSGTRKDGNFVDGREGLIVINTERKGESNITAINIICKLDGNEVFSRPVDLGYDAQKAYIDSTSTNEHRAMPDYSAYSEGNFSQLYYYIDGERTIPYGGVMELYIEAIDSYGLHYLALCDAVEVDSTTGEPNYKHYNFYSGAEASIYDANGKLLYDAIRIE